MLLPFEFEGVLDLGAGAPAAEESQEEPDEQEPINEPSTGE